MKNLKKLMSVVLSVAMLMSFVVSTSAATFADVAEDNSAYEAVEVLAALEILEGKEEGNFDPNADIKRSEFAAVICRAMNQEAAATGSAGSSSFADVAAEHWAVGYINWAAQQGIVNGRGNGIFDPDASVTYQEAVKMVVCALGFGPLAEKRGGYPTGYMVIASSYGVTNNVAMTPATGNATRAGVAQLVYNSFDAPLMDAAYISFDGSDEYKVYDGSKAADYERRTLLSYYADTYKVKAVVKNTYKTDSNLINRKGEKQIELTLKNFYKFDEEDVLGGDYEIDSAYKFLANNDAYGDYVGYTVNAYIAENADGDYEVLAMVPDNKSVETLVIDNAKSRVETAAVVEVEDEHGEVVDVYVAFEYWEDLDDNKVTEVDMAEPSATTLYVNGVQKGLLSVAANASILEAGEYTSVTLVGSRATGVYDKIFLTSYEYGLVEEVDVEAEIIETDNETYTLAEDDNVSNFVYTIFKDGVEIALSDIAVGDMVNVIRGGDDFLEIYVTNTVVEGSVDEYRVENGATVYTIGDADYTGVSALSLKAGDAGKFYITIDGYIYDVEKTKTYSDNYAFILDIGEVDNGWGTTYQVKLLTKDNSIATYSIADTVKITEYDGVSEYETNKVKDEAQADYFAYDGTLGSLIYSDVDTKITAEATLEANIQNRMIIFKASGNTITDITLPWAAAEDGDFNTAALPASAEYTATNEKLAGYYVSSGSVIFSIPVTAKTGGGFEISENKVQVYAASSLVEDQVYEGYIYSKDENRSFGAVAIYSDLGFAGNMNALAVVRGLATGLDSNGNAAIKVTLVQAGEVKSLVVSEDEIASFDFDDLTAGDVIQYTTNAAGEIYNAEWIADYNEGVITLNTVGDAKVAYTAGVVTDVVTKGYDLTNAAGDVEVLGKDFTADSTIVQVDTARIETSVTNAIKANDSASFIKARLEGDVFKAVDAYVVVARVVDEDIVDVVAYRYDVVRGETTVDDVVDAVFPELA